MRYALVTLCFLLLMNAPAAAQDKPLENVLTKVLTIDGNALPDEYLLAQPQGAQLNKNGDIVVLDENRLKVFGPDGRPKRIVGGPGEGPGEFSGQYLSMSITDAGFITVSDYRLGMYHIFDAGYEFIKAFRIKGQEIERKFKEDHGFEHVSLSGMMTVSPGEHVMYVQSYKEDAQYHAWLQVDSEKNDYSVIVMHEDQSSVQVGGMRGIVMEYGFLHFGLLGYPRTMFIYPRQDAFQRDGRDYFRLHIRNLHSEDESLIEHEYTPVAIPDSVISMREKFAGQVGERQRPFEEALLKKLKDLKNYGAVKGLTADGNTLFVKTYTHAPEKGDLYYVFDADSGKKLSSVYFPISVFPVRDGLICRTVNSENAFPFIEIYRIDPAVYGK